VVLSYVFYAIGYYLQLGMLLMGRTKLIGMIGAAAVPLNLGLNYFLVLHYGMLGAAWATLLSFAAMAIASYRLSERVLPLPLAVSRVAAAIALAVGLYILSRLWSPGSLALALLVKAAFLAAFPVLVWTVRILAPPEIETLTSARNSALSALSQLVGRFSEKVVGS
jgi:O-antigen/teichoic acid export membrane protein